VKRLGRSRAAALPSELALRRFVLGITCRKTAQGIGFAATPLSGKEKRLEGKTE